MAVLLGGCAATVGWATLFPVLDPSIVRLEFAPTTTSAQAVIIAWESHGQLGDAKRSVRIDLVWIVLYTPSLAAAAVLTARSAPARGAAPAVRSVLAALVYVAFAAGALDYVEDSGLWLMLDGHTAQPVPMLTTVVAATKWLGIGVVGGAALGCLAITGARRLRGG